MAMVLSGCAVDRMFSAPPELTALPQQSPDGKTAADGRALSAQPLLTKDGLAIRPPLLLSAAAPSGIQRQANPAPFPPQAAPPLLAGLSKAASPAGAVVTPLVLLYSSPTTEKHFSVSGIDSKGFVQAWEGFLRKYKIPYTTTSAVERLEQSTVSVLLLPSSVALTEREMQAVIDFRTRGGSVLATWQSGTRSASGEWLGYKFMEDALDTRVLGTTEKDQHDTFLLPYGDSPVSHYLPSGLRVWTERVNGWFPLRLAGQYTAARITDWSRNAADGNTGGAIVFGERTASAKASRAVVFGFPERLWLTADPKAIEALAHNALTWLLRIPDAYLAAWPHPFGTATVLAIDLVDTPVDTDLAIARMVGDVGGKASYFVLTEHIAPSADILKKIAAQGHELGYLGDRFGGFKEQPRAEQAKRMDTMLAEMKAARLAAVAAGFHPPMESYDATTVKLLQEREFGYLVAGPEASEARLPVLATGAAVAATARSLVTLPRTLNSPEDLVSEEDPASGMKNFFREFNAAEEMAGLSVLRITGQTLLSDPQMAEIAAYLKTRRERMWFASAGQVAEWWRQRASVKASIDTSRQPPVLTVSIPAGSKLPGPAAVWVNLPAAGSNLRLSGGSGTRLLPNTSRIDAWRHAIILDNLAPGEYRWQVYFDASSAHNSQ